MMDRLVETAWLLDDRVRLGADRVPGRGPSGWAMTMPRWRGMSEPGESNPCARFHVALVPYERLAITIERRPGIGRKLPTVVAADGVEPSRARVWAAPVPCTGCATRAGGRTATHGHMGAMLRRISRHSRRRVDKVRRRGDRARWESCGPLVSVAGIAPAFPVGETGVLAAVRHGRQSIVIVGREGIEPSFRRSKNPLQSQRLLPTLAVSRGDQCLNQRGHQVRPLILRAGGGDRARLDRCGAPPGHQNHLRMPRLPGARQPVIGCGEAPVIIRSSSSSLFGCQGCRDAQRAPRAWARSLLPRSCLDETESSHDLES